MRIFGIDYGDRRTGVAVSDPFGWTAQGLEAVVGNMDASTRRIASLVAEYGAQTVVIGYPLNMDGSAGTRAARTDMFARKLSGQIGGGVELVKWDERLTTVQATRSMRETGARSKPGEDRKGAVDIIAATILLQSYLDSRRDKNREDGI